MMYNTKNLSHPLVFHYSQGLCYDLPTPIFLLFYMGIGPSWKLKLGAVAQIKPWTLSPGQDGSTGVHSVVCNWEAVVHDPSLSTV